MTGSALGNSVKGGSKATFARLGPPTHNTTRERARHSGWANQRLENWIRENRTYGSERGQAKAFPTLILSMLTRPRQTSVSAAATSSRDEIANWATSTRHRAGVIEMSKNADLTADRDFTNAIRPHCQRAGRTRFRFHFAFGEILDINVGQKLRPAARSADHNSDQGARTAVAMNDGNRRRCSEDDRRKFKIGRHEDQGSAHDRCRHGNWRQTFEASECPDPFPCRKRKPDGLICLTENLRRPRNGSLCCPGRLAGRRHRASQGYRPGAPMPLCVCWPFSGEHDLLDRDEQRICHSGRTAR